MKLELFKKITHSPSSGDNLRNTCSDLFYMKSASGFDYYSVKYPVIQYIEGTDENDSYLVYNEDFYSTGSEMKVDTFITIAFIESLTMQTSPLKEVSINIL